MRRVIVVTDGDCTALESVEVASHNVGARCISLSGCRHPEDARWDPEEVEELILSTPQDPVVVLVDDEGKQGEGWGEKLLKYLSKSTKIKVIGAVAVASNLDGGYGAKVDISVVADGTVINGAVTKDGHPVEHETDNLHGDTVENLNELDLPIVVGLGDPGKMNEQDEAKSGAPITTKALEIILSHDHLE